MFIVNEARLSIAGKGTLCIDSNKSIKHVLYVPVLTKNLLSVGRLTDLGYYALFTPYSCFLLDEQNPTSVFMYANRDPRSRLYKVKPFHPQLSEQSRQLLRKVHATLRQIKPPDFPHFVGITKDTPTVATISLIDAITLWHHRLCHLNFKTAHHISAKRFVKGLPYLPSSREHKCITCVLSKQHRVHMSKKPAKQSTWPLELIHTDVCGPVVAGTEFKYMLTFIDDYSRYTWTYFL